MPYFPVTLRVTAHFQTLRPTDPVGLFVVRWSPRRLPLLWAIGCMRVLPKKPGRISAYVLRLPKNPNMARDNVFRLVISATVLAGVAIGLCANAHPDPARLRG
jgi:hypothetical protein